MPKSVTWFHSNRASFSATEDQTEGLEIHKLAETEGGCSKSAEHLKWRKGLSSKYLKLC